MRNTIEVIKSTVERYNGDGNYLVLLGLCMFGLWLLSGKKKEARSPILIYTILVCMCLLCPVSAFVLIKCIGANVYWRVFWILPFVLIIAYSVVIVLDRIKNISWKVIVGILLCGVVMAAGVNVYNPHVFTKATNSYKLPDEVIAVCDIVVKRGEGQSIKLAAPDELNPYIRLYRPNINQVFGRETMKEGAYDSGEAVILYNIMSQKPYHMESVIQGAVLNQCNFIVLKRADLTSEMIEEYGTELVGQTENYVVFYIES